MMPLKPRSTSDKNIETIADITMTTIVPSFKSALLGQVTDFISARTSRKNFLILSNFIYLTISIGMLPLRHCCRIKCGRTGRNRTRNPRFWRPVLYQLNYCPATYLSQRFSAVYAVYVSGKWGRISSAPSCSDVCACFWWSYNYDSCILHKPEL